MHGGGDAAAEAKHGLKRKDPEVAAALLLGQMGQKQEAAKEKQKEKKKATPIS